MLEEEEGFDDASGWLSEEAPLVREISALISREFLFDFSLALAASISLAALFGLDAMVTDDGCWGRVCCDGGLCDDDDDDDGCF